MHYQASLKLSIKSKRFYSDPLTLRYVHTDVDISECNSSTEDLRLTKDAVKDDLKDTLD